MVIQSACGPKMRIWQICSS